MEKEKLFSKDVLAKPASKRAIRNSMPIRYTGFARMGYNENPYGMAESVKEVIRDAIEYGHFYPEFQYDTLRAALAEKYNMKPSNFVIGEGSSDLINIVGQAFLNPGDEVIICPTFYAFNDMAEIGRAKLITVPLLEDKRYDLDGIYNAITDKTKIIVITNPNNPTGQYVGIDAIHDFVAKIPDNIVVFIDEAYIDFATAPDCKSAVGLVEEFPEKPIIVMRTFSKYYALAGVRIGYLLCSEQVAAGILIVPISTVSQLSQRAALQSLKEEAFYQASREKIVEGVRYLEKELERLGCKVYPSQSNFIMFEPYCDYIELQDALLEKKIHIAIPMMNRVTASTKENNEYFIQCMEEILPRLRK